MNYDELCVAIAKYATEFRKTKSQNYQSDMRWDEENRYIVENLKAKDGINFSSIKELKVFRCEANLQSDGKYL